MFFLQCYPEISEFLVVFLCITTSLNALLMERVMLTHLEHLVLLPHVVVVGTVQTFVL